MLQKLNKTENIAFEVKQIYLQLLYLQIIYIFIIQHR